ncbi:hypothetical protein BC830DRAFT_1159159 [Chytriomyces sp. MP71]|nr:hypothetical protein BC830DRAFT_1159159 [Chytriomyces sp. MP71]
MRPRITMRSDLDRMGVFNEPSYISTMEPYRGKKTDEVIPTRGKGKQFETSPSKTGLDAKSFVRLFENERYNDPSGKFQDKAKNISQVPFRPSSSTPKSSGSGSPWGTFDQQYPLPTKWRKLKLRPESPKESKESKPNFLTRPPPKGSGYGYPNVTIGKSYEHMSEPYERFLELARKDFLASKKKRLSDQPFISSTARIDFFDAFVGLMGSEKSRKTWRKTSESNLKSTPFKPSSCCGYTINRYPSYDSISATLDANPKKPGKTPTPIFRPSGSSKSTVYPVRSIIEANCPMAPPAWLWDIVSHNAITVQRRS